MWDSRRLDRERRFTILDYLMLIAGFACGFVLHQNSALRSVTRYYFKFTLAGADFKSSLGFAIAGWLWALVVGLVFVIAGRRFRYGGRIRPAEWLAVSLAILLVDSAIPAYVPDNECEYQNSVFVRANSPQTGSPVVYRLVPRSSAASREYWRAFALEMSAVAILLGLGGWFLRKRISPGWFAILAVALATLLVLGPVRMVEALSSEYTHVDPDPLAERYADRILRTSAGLAIYVDAHAWLAYSVRAALLWAVAIVATIDLFLQRGGWSPTETSAAAAAFILAFCWAYDEFVSRPALDRPERVIALGAWLALLGVLTGVLICAGTFLKRRRRGGSTGLAT
jgi:hypothetical protein